MAALRALARSKIVRDQFAEGKPVDSIAKALELSNQDIWEALCNYHTYDPRSKSERFLLPEPNLLGILSKSLNGRVLRNSDSIFYLDVPVDIKIAKFKLFSPLATILAKPDPSTCELRKYLSESSNWRECLLAVKGVKSPIAMHIERILRVNNFDVGKNGHTDPAFLIPLNLNPIIILGTTEHQSTKEPLTLGHLKQLLSEADWENTVLQRIREFASSKDLFI